MQNEKQHDRRSCWAQRCTRCPRPWCPPHKVRYVRCLLRRALEVDPLNEDIALAPVAFTMDTNYLRLRTAIRCVVTSRAAVHLRQSHQHLSAGKHSWYRVCFARTLRGANTPCDSEPHTGVRATGGDLNSGGQTTLVAWQSFPLACLMKSWTCVRVSPELS